VYVKPDSLRFIPSIHIIYIFYTKTTTHIDCRSIPAYKTTPQQWSSGARDNEGGMHKTNTFTFRRYEKENDSTNVDSA